MPSKKPVVLPSSLGQMRSTRRTVPEAKSLEAGSIIRRLAAVEEDLRQTRLEVQEERRLRDLALAERDQCRDLVAIAGAYVERVDAESEDQQPRSVWSREDVLRWRGHFATALERIEESEDDLETEAEARRAGSAA